jgi:integrase
MARKRLQQCGELRVESGQWKLRWREDQISADGTLRRGWSKLVALGPARGPHHLTEKQARRLAWDLYLCKLDQNNATPQSVLTVAQFVAQRFLPGHVDMLKKNTRLQYASLLKNHILPFLGSMRMRDVGVTDVQKALSAMRAKGLSTKTVRNTNVVISAMFSYAERVGCFTGRNPAALVTLPECMHTKPRHAPTVEQLSQVLSVLPDPARGVAMLASFSSMNGAEIAGLKWEYVNLTDEYRQHEDEVIPPRSLLVRWQWANGEYGSVKQPSRRRTIPLIDIVLAYLKQIERPNGPVFAGRTGKPVDLHNLFNRVLRPTGVRLGMPWLGWHSFRRAHATMADQLAVAMSDRLAMMGHSRGAMTMHYTAEDLRRRKSVIEQMAARVFGSGRVQ